MIRDIAPRQRVAAAVVSFALAVAAAPLLALNFLRRRKRTVSRILVIEPWGIGDLVLATGALRSCRTAFPDARIAVLAKSYAEALIVSPEMADEVAAYDFPWTAFTGKYRLSRYRFTEIARLLLRLRRARYDLVLNARADVRNNLLGAMIGGSRFVSVECGLGDILATDVVAVGRDAHRAEDWAEVVRVAGVVTTESAPRLTVDVVSKASMANALGLRTRARRVIGVHPGAAMAVRRWDLERFARVADTLAERYDATVIVFVEPDGYGASIPMARPFIPVRRPLREMMVALSLCDVVVCNDSGPMHIANALGVPVVALFGPGQLEWFAPLGGPSRIVRVEDMPCRPCFDACSFPTPHCMTGLSDQNVIESAIELLGESGLRPDYSLPQLRVGVRS